MRTQASLILMLEIKVTLSYSMCPTFFAGLNIGMRQGVYVVPKTVEAVAPAFSVSWLNVVAGYGSRSTSSPPPPSLSPSGPVVLDTYVLVQGLPE